MSDLPYTLSTPQATVIISIYRDIEALDIILDALERQTISGFEVIVSEDGEAPEVATYLAQQQRRLPIQHLTQPDKGFRKNRALNRAILAARSDRIIFIDGDCVPHFRFVEAHLACLSPGVTCTGRRVELGPLFSRRMRDKSLPPWELGRPATYLRYALALHRDQVKNYESGIASSLLQRLSVSRPLHMLGCNFSAHRRDLMAINGLNEDFHSPGIGEDSDVEWRMLRAGVAIRNVKFSAVQYHLYHPRGYTVSEANLALMRDAQARDKYICPHGIRQHHDVNTPR